jgi:hypothetical protein
MTDISHYKQQLNDKILSFHNKNIEDDSNFKFMNLLRSRLTEEGIPLEAATQIVANIDYDMSAVNEDDDYIGDVALAYAEFAARVYDKLKAGNWHRNMTDSVVRKYFAHFKITLDVPERNRQLALDFNGQDA